MVAVPLVSIIVPSYRHQKYILECLQSLHDQTYKRIELVLIDDASPDATFEVAARLLDTGFSSRFENVVARKRPSNGGAHTALNEGLERAAGDYLAIVNSDDLYRPERIERLVGALIERSADFAFSGVETLERDLTADDLPVADNLILTRLCQSLAVAREIAMGYALLRQNVAISTGNFVFSRALARQVGGFIPLQYCHDWDFILQATRFTEPLFVDETLYVYRLHGRNTFQSMASVANLETDVVIRRFFRAVLRSPPPNLKCPCPHHAPGTFEAFIHVLGYGRSWAIEAGLPTPQNRIYAPRPDPESRPESAFRRIADRLARDAAEAAEAAFLQQRSSAEA